MKNQSYFDKELNLAILKRFAEDWANQLAAIEEISLYFCSHEESAKFVLVFSIDEQVNPNDLETFIEWQAGGEACPHIQRELADAYYPPLEKGAWPMEWICFVEPAGTTDRPCDLIIIESKVILFNRRAAVGGPTPDEEKSDDPPQEFAVETLITYDPAKRKGFRFKISLRGKEDKFFKKGWQVLNILSRCCGEKVLYDVVYSLYTETAAPPDGSGHKTKTKGDEFVFQQLAPSTSEDDNLGFSTAERTFKKADQEAIDNFVKEIKNLKKEEIDLIEAGHSKGSKMVLRVRAEYEELEDHLLGISRTVRDAQGEEVLRPKYEKSRLAKKKSTIKKAIKGAKKEAEDAWPELWQYLEDHLEVAKDFLRLRQS